MTIRFVREALHELLEAISYYEDVRGGLGRRFKDEVDRCIRWVAEYPELYRLRASGHRRINLRAFPYYVAYLPRGTTIWILAIAHGSRKPLYWISRRENIE